MRSTGAPAWPALLPNEASAIRCSSPAASCPHLPAQSPDAKIRMYMVYLKYYTLNLRPPMVYPKVLVRLNFSTYRPKARP